MPAGKEEILVVSQSRHQPGQGFIAWDVNDLEEGYAQVYSFGWTELPNPFQFADDGDTLDELAHRLLTHPEDATEVYQQVKNRGSRKWSSVWRCSPRTVA